MEQEKDLLARIDGTIQEAIGGVVRLHQEVGQAVANTVKASTFGKVDESLVDRVQQKELEVVASVGDGLKRATSVVTDTLRRVGKQITG
jgi:hypothetical protein